MLSLELQDRLWWVPICWGQVKGWCSQRVWFGFDQEGRSEDGAAGSMQSSSMTPVFNLFLQGQTCCFPRTCSAHNSHTPLQILEAHYHLHQGLIQLPNTFYNYVTKSLMPCNFKL